MIQVKLAFLMDCTGSMEPWIQAAKDQITTIINDAVRENGDNVNVSVGFVGYRDYGDLERFIVEDFQDSVSILHRIRNVHADGGDDEAEDVAGGISQLRSLDWNDADVKLIVHIADAPGHGNMFHTPYLSDRFPRGDPGGLLVMNAISHLSSHGYDYTFVKINETTDIMIEEFSKCYIHDAIFKVVDLSGQHRRASTPTFWRPRDDPTLLLTPAITRSITSSVHRYTATQDPSEV
jgi:hypothetical protein